MYWLEKVTIMRHAANALEMIFARPRTPTDTDRLGLPVKGASATEEIAFDCGLSALNGAPPTLYRFDGCILSIVDIVSRPEDTPQFQGLPRLHGTYYAKGRKFISVSSNDIANQELGARKKSPPPMLDATQ